MTDESESPDRAAGGSTRRSDDPGARSPERRRLFDRAWLWIFLVVLVVGGALVASFVVERRHDADLEVPPLAQEEYCNTASEIRSFPQLTVDLGAGGSAELQRFQSELDRLASVAPAPIAQDIRDIRASLDPVIEVLGAGGGSPEAINHALEVLDQQSTAVTDQAARVSVYTDRWCGFDLMTPSDTTSVAPLSTVSITPPTTASG